MKIASPSFQNLVCFSSHAFSVLSWLVLSLVSVPNLACAGDAKQICKELVQIVGSDEPTEWEKAESLYSQIPESDPTKPVARQSLALIQIRQAKYSEAWKLLAGQKGNVAPSIKVGQERLKLWLLVQANSEKSALSQLQNVIKVAQDDSQRQADRKLATTLIGQLVGILETANEDSCISQNALEEALVKMRSMESKSAIATFLDNREQGTKQAEALKALCEDYKAAGISESESKLKSLNQELVDAKKEHASLKGESSAETKKKKQLDDERKKLIRELAAIQNSWDDEEPGRPTPPRAPNEPNRPNTVFNQDPKTGQRSVDEAQTRRKQDQYRREMDDYRADFNRYRAAEREYETKLAAWKAKEQKRRQDLKDKKEKREQELADKIKELGEQSKEAALDFENSQQALANLKALETEIELGQFAINHLKTPDKNPLFRPSHFQLIDFDDEQTRLEICLK